MEKYLLSWQVGCCDDVAAAVAEWMPAQVPGAVQLDYARAKGWAPYYMGLNFRDYKWMEDKFWCYRAPLDFALRDDQRATLVFLGIDYRYEIRVDGEFVHGGEGMFAPVRLDVTAYAGEAHELTVLLWPVPKADDSDTRDQARLSAKPAVSYGWDFHPRLVPSGIWDEAYLEIGNERGIEEFDVRYQLSDDLGSVTVRAQADVTMPGKVRFAVSDENGVVAETTVDSCRTAAAAELVIAQPKLWYPLGYGDQPLYTITAETIDETGAVTETRCRRLGFRRSRMVMNAGAWSRPSGMPRSRSDAPATLEINGRKLFARGSNWVGTDIFAGEMTREHYDELLTQAAECNVIILRIWGGAFVNKESFFELCDEKGIMVWQEFPLACNEYPDDPHYLAVLEHEARAIVRRLRTHPSLVIWCGGNELFNSWSGMTEQHHALRLLNAVCYDEDQYTPFLYTSPLTGMSHGHYHSYDEETGEELLTLLRNSHFTGYNEFGCPAYAPADYIRTFMSEEEFQSFGPESEIWRERHAFGVWRERSWGREDEVNYFLGGYESVDDLCEKSQFVQSMCLRSDFEEMRRQWPQCSFAMNWCFNEPWPAAANNSVVAWPAVRKPAYYAMQTALRPRMASLALDRQLWRGGETFRAEIWMHNDTIEEMPAGEIRVSYKLDGEEIQWGTLRYAALPEQTNSVSGSILFPLPEDFDGLFEIRLEVVGHPDWSAEYRYPCRAKVQKSQKKVLNM
ncbi:MAG: hypothetical protein E7458_06210 [Ruminococcaceae bacterium]|nr:hypothetical protein [Oscillospiraceae bacterium]